MTKVLAKTRRKGPVVIICLTNDKPNALMGVSTIPRRICPRQRHFLLGKKILPEYPRIREGGGGPLGAVDNTRVFYLAETRKISI